MEKFFVRKLLGCKVTFLGVPQEEAGMGGDQYPLQQVLHFNVVHLLFAYSNINIENHQ